MKKSLLVLAMIALLGVLAGPAFAGYPKSQQYMSEEGYARWQHFKATGVWLPR